MTVEDGAEAIYAVPAKHSITGGEFISANGKEIGSYATSRKGLAKERSSRSSSQAASSRMKSMKSLLQKARHAKPMAMHMS